jgi:O-antigen ligase
VGGSRPAFAARAPLGLRPSRRAWEAAASLGALCLGVVLGVALQGVPLSWPLVLAVSVGLVGILSLAVVRYEHAVALGIALLGVVVVEPAPPDAVFGAVIAVAIVTGRFRLDRMPLSVLALSTIFIALNLASAVDAIDPAVAARFMLITIYLVVFAVWITGYVNGADRGRQVLVWYLFAAASSALLASASLFVSFPGSESMNDGFRARGLFEDPNVYGPFLVPAALILLEETITPRLLRMRAVTKLLLLGLLAVGLLFSFSRGAWLNFGLGVIFMLVVLSLRRGGGRRATLVLVLLCALGVSALGAASLTGQLDFLQERAQRQSYDVERFAAQRKGLEYGREHLLGIGPGQFEVREVTVSHNSYVRAMAEQGFLGLLTIVALFGTTLVVAIRSAALGRSSGGIGSAALLAAWVGLVVESFFVDTLHWRHLWLVAGLIWVASRLPPDQ